MYEFSRSIYRELAAELPAGEGGTRDRLEFLQACEAAFERLAKDRYHFAHPTRTLFRDVRIYFPLSSHARVHEVIARHMTLAIDYVDLALREGRSVDDSRPQCHAHTRSGSQCQREPLPGKRYCPSHKHLEEDVGLSPAARSWR